MLGKDILGATTAALAFLTLPLAAAEAAPAGNATAGKVVFARCAACHDVKPGAKKLGPHLAGLSGRRAGAVANFSYSPALKNAKIAWTPQALDAFLTNPQKHIPGNRMAFPGIANATDRANLIAYLKSVPK